MIAFWAFLIKNLMVCSHLSQWYFHLKTNNVGILKKLCGSVCENGLFTCGFQNDE